MMTSQFSNRRQICPICGFYWDRRELGFLDKGRGVYGVCTCPNCKKRLAWYRIPPRDNVDYEVVHLLDMDVISETWHKEQRLIDYTENKRKILLYTHTRTVWDAREIFRGITGEPRFDKRVAIVAQKMGRPFDEVADLLIETGLIYRKSPEPQPASAPAPEPEETAPA